MIVLLPVPFYVLIASPEAVLLVFTAHRPPPTAHSCCLCKTQQAPWEDFGGRLSELGFEKGWGRDVALVREQFRQLLDILQVGDAAAAAAAGCAAGWLAFP